MLRKPPGQLPIELPAPTPESAGVQHLPHDALQVARASALLWGPRTRTDLLNLLPKLGATDERGRRFTGEAVKAALDVLRRDGLLQEDPRRPGYLSLADPLRVALYRRLLDEFPQGRLLALLTACEGVNLDASHSYWYSLPPATSVSLLRASLLSGLPEERVERIRQLTDRQLGADRAIELAVLSPFDATSFEHIDPRWRWGIASAACMNVAEHWNERHRPVVDWCLARFAADPQSVPAQPREALALNALQRGDLTLVRRCLDGLDDGMADALRAAALVLESRWADAQAAFEPAIKKRQVEVSARKRVFPESVIWLYPLALLAQGAPEHLELARKFCVGEAGRREPYADEPWGRWVNAIDARLGRAPLVPTAFSLEGREHEPLSLHLLWKVLLAAWLGPDELAKPARGASARQKAQGDSLLDALREALQANGFAAHLRLLDGARQVLAGGEPPRGFFVSGRGEAWREVLVALQALGVDSSGNEAPTEKKSRLLWAIDVDDGELVGIAPLEQKRSARGWGTPKPVSLARIAKDTALSPADAKVARCLRAERGYASRFDLDLAAAIVALVGHPGVVLARAPERPVELVESPPELEVVRDGDRYVMRVHPAPRPASEAEAYYYDARDRRDAEALRLITLLPDGAQRLRLIRYTAAQLRAAQLVSGRFAVPAAADAQAELQKTLHALTGHFQVLADAAQASRQVAAETRLRALLSPVGEALHLQLVAAPLGEAGPRLVPGRGRARLLAAIDGETVGTARKLEAERAQLEAVLEALPDLDAVGDDGGGESCEWMLDNPELALGIVEALPSLPAIAAIEWPKGKKLRVLTVDSGQVGVKVSRERDWFRVSGQAELDDGLVIQLETLLAAATGSSRFIPIGDGVYAALTRSLRQKLVDLAAVAEPDKSGHKVPPLAAAWLDDLLDGTTVDAGKEFRQAIDRLRAAQQSTPTLPRTLQAELRPYQEDGYQWAMRLAQAGLGACLADDMGLGKTLQALAVLLARAADGPALVVAPTSVCGNWLAESLRFAPSLNARIYSEADEAGREALVADAGSHDVLIVSYTLLQLAQERFAARRWQTLVADEAQAVKNAAAKRSQALFELDADFRLALSGTPVENRLAELWSIMRFANPGLLGSSGRFSERFAAPIERNRDREAQLVLKRLIGPFVLRRTKAQVLEDLPPRTELVLAIAPEAAEAAHYEALRRQAVREVSQLAGAPAGQARFNILAQLTRLRRAACDPRLTSPDLGITGAKVQAFAELAAELAANGHKTLVFSQFVDFLQLLRAPLDEAGLAYQYLDGATPAAERSRRVAAFQAGDGDFFLISLKAGGFGLNLTAADYVVITDPWWNPAAEDQAMGRAHRIGQQRPVTVYRLVGKGTIEERIVALHHDKRVLAESILDDGDAAALPSTEDLVALIRGE